MPMHEDHYDGGDGWVAGVDFDPSDPDEMEIMRVVWEKEKYDKLARLEREVELLRAALIAREQLQNALDKGASVCRFQPRKGREGGLVDSVNTG